jgi:hypothetical protein
VEVCSKAEEIPYASQRLAKRSLVNGRGDNGRAPGRNTAFTADIA